jgi:hypothetical protein
MLIPSTPPKNKKNSEWLPGEAARAMMMTDDSINDEKQSKTEGTIITIIITIASQLKCTQKKRRKN